MYKLQANGNQGELVYEGDIKRCPFCGANPEIYHIGNEKSKAQSIKIRCPECRVERTTSVIYKDIDWCFEEVIRSWNMRYEESEESTDCIECGHDVADDKAKCDFCYSCFHWERCGGYSGYEDEVICDVCRREHAA